MKTVVCVCKCSVYCCLLCGAAVTCVSACTQVSFESDFLRVCQRKRISRKSVWRPKLLEAVADESSTDCIIVGGASGEETAEQYQRRLKYKLLQFHENFRPAYWGTWRKRGSMLSPRNPFKKDEVRKVSLGPLHLFTSWSELVCESAFVSWGAILQMLESILGDCTQVLHMTSSYYVAVYTYERYTKSRNFSRNTMQCNNSKNQIVQNAGLSSAENETNM